MLLKASLLFSACVLCAQPRFNLNGIWDATYKDEAPLPVRISQEGQVITLADAPPAAPEIFFRGAYESNPRIVGFQPSGPQNPQPKRLLLQVEDPDHLRLINPDHPDTPAYLARTSAPGHDDALCDVGNTSRTQPAFAYKRGQSAARSRDYAKMECWFAAAGDYPQAQGALAAMFYHGSGVTQDLDLAFALAQKGAEGHDPESGFMLAGMYRAGQGTPRNPERAAYWMGRAADDMEKSMTDEDYEQMSKFTERMERIFGSFDGGLIDGQENRIMNQNIRLRACGSLTGPCKYK